MRILIVLLLLMTWASVPTAQVPRNVYVTPVDGSGTDIDPYRSRCFRMVGAGNIDLRPWGINRWLCASDVLPQDMTGVLQIGASLNDSLTGVKKTALNALVGKTLTSTTVQGAIEELLKDRLRAGKDGKLKIWLGGGSPIYQKTAWVPFEDGGLVADATNAAVSLIEPALAWAASITEDWNCADSGDLTCDLTWTEFFGTNFQILSNEARVSATNGTMDVRADTAMDSVDHEATVTIVSLSIDSATFSGCGPIVRQPGDSTRTYYMHRAQRNSTGELSEHGLRKRVTGSLTTLSEDTTDMANGETVTVRADGDQITGLRNGVVLIGPVTDTSITTGTSTGLTHATLTDVAVCIMDDFSAQDIASTSIVRQRGPVVF
jgi:hypothetical protein